MDDGVPEIEKSLGHHLTQFGQRKDKGDNQSVSDFLDSERFARSTSPLTDVRRG